MARPRFGGGKVTLPVQPPTSADGLKTTAFTDRIPNFGAPSGSSGPAGMITTLKAAGTRTGPLTRPSTTSTPKGYAKSPAKGGTPPGMAKRPAGKATPPGIAKRTTGSTSAKPTRSKSLQAKTKAKTKGKGKGRRPTRASMPPIVRQPGPTR